MGYPPTEPHAQGMLDVGDGQQVYWEVSGNPKGKPAVLLHGGPGSGSYPGQRRWFDPAAYRIVQFDQRGCRRSTPSASDPQTDLSSNTTHHLIADMERLRQHLEIDRWLVCGASWGVTLGLAYAERHSERVTEAVFLSVTMKPNATATWSLPITGSSTSSRMSPCASQSRRTGVIGRTRWSPSTRGGNLMPVTRTQRFA